MNLTLVQKPVQRSDSERLDWLSSRCNRDALWIWLPTALYARELPDLRAAIDEAMAYRGIDHAT